MARRGSDLTPRLSCPNIMLSSTLTAMNRADRLIKKRPIWRINFLTDHAFQPLRKVPKSAKSSLAQPTSLAPVCVHSQTSKAGSVLNNNGFSSSHILRIGARSASSPTMKRLYQEAIRQNNMMLTHGSSSNDSSRLSSTSRWRNTSLILSVSVFSLLQLFWF